jgi:hypothetical protein
MNAFGKIPLGNQWTFVLEAYLITALVLVDMSTARGLQELSQTRK